MTINLGAYSTEIIRAGIEAVPKGHIEAGISLAMTKWEVLRHIVLKQAFEKIYPALSSQIIIVMLGSAVVSQISAQDLTYAANFIASRNFRNFEVYLLVALAYLLLAMLTRSLLRGLGRVPVQGEVNHVAVQPLGHPVEPADRHAVDHRAVADRLRLRRHCRADPAVHADLRKSRRWNGPPRSISSCSRARRC